MTAAALIQRLGLVPHPEGGWYRELHRSAFRVQAPQGGRAALTTIYYLLEAGQQSRWHVVASDEVWHFYAGAPLELLAYHPSSRKLLRHVLATPGLEESTTPVATIPAGVWQAARPLGEFALVGCSVGPGFEFSDFRFTVDLADHRQHFNGELARYYSLL